MKKFRFMVGVVGMAICIIANAATMGGVMGWPSVVWAERGEDIVNEEVIEDDAMWPEIYIKAINPGYTVDGQSNVGEMIEIGWKGGVASSDDVEALTDSDKMISLAGVTVRYTTTSGGKTDLVAFPENSYLAGESIILRLASSPDHELANLNYTKTLAYAGSLEILKGEEVMDALCWTGEEGCYPKFKSGSGASLVRRGLAEYELVEGYEPAYDAGNYQVIGKGGDDGGDGTEADGAEAVSQCRGLVFSELLSYYVEAQAEQFIEFFNTGSEQILLDGCAVRYKNKVYPLAGIVQAEEYKAWYLTDFSITKNPTNSNVLELLDTTGEVLDKLEYPNGQKKGTSWAFIGYDEVGEELWRTTYAITPGEPNVYQEYKSCEAGKVINEATGNCVKVTTVAEKICGEGQYLNPLTNRCKKIETEATTECKEGYERNPDTGRCRKIKENDGANYAIVAEEYEEKTSFVAIYAIAIVVALGLVYAIYEFRHELVRLARRVCRRFR